MPESALARKMKLKPGQRDLTRDKGWDTVQQAGLKWVNLISLNDAWSAFSLRPYKPGEERQSVR